MTAKALLPLDSYRLVQYAVQVPCYICNGGNTFDAELCRHCQAPMALSHQANTQKVHPQMIAAIGSSGAGKTVYLGMLIDMLSRQSERMQLLARGAFSINLQQATMSALARREFPVKTPNEPDRWNWVHCQIRAPRHRQPVELIMPDMAGEALIEEVEHPHTYPVIRSFLSKCAGVMILVDAGQLEDGGRDQDYVTMKLLTYLSGLNEDPKTGWRNRPIALILSKADQCEACFDDPADYAKRHAEGLWQHCREEFPHHKFFASGVAGACAYRAAHREERQRIPLRIEPRGITEPFEWLIDKIKLDH
jgi:hypothetical protein